MRKLNTHKKIVQEYYSKRVLVYDKQKKRTWKSKLGFSSKVLDEIADMAGKAKTGPGLEVGIGSGRISSHLMNNNMKMPLVGLDLSKDMLKLLKSKKTYYDHRLDLVQADAEYLPFRNEIFSFLACISIFHYLNGPFAALKEFARALRKGGILILGDIAIHEKDRNDIVDKLEKTISIAHGRYYKPSQMCKLMEKYEFGVTKTKILPYRKPFTSLIEDKAQYFDVELENLYDLIKQMTKAQRQIYEINDKEMTLYYMILSAVKM